MPDLRLVDADPFRMQIRCVVEPHDVLDARVDHDVVDVLVHTPTGSSGVTLSLDEIEEFREWLRQAGARLRSSKRSPVRKS